MNFIRNTSIALAAVIMLVAFSATSQAQDRTTAVKLFNQAREMAKNNEYDQAIGKFQEAIAAGKQLGEKGKDIIDLSEKQLPSIFYEKAVGDYRAFQKAKTESSLQTTIDSFRDAADAGKEYGNKSIADKANGNVLQLRYKMSVLQYSQQKYGAALTTINSVIADNPNYANAYFHKALILKKQKSASTEDMLAMFDKAIEVGGKTNNANIVRQAKESAAKQLTYLGSEQTKQKNYSAAIKLLNQALKYDSTSPEAYFRLAEAYNDRSDWNNALDNAKKALANEKGGRTDKAKIYFEEATAYKGLGQFKQACDAFANASYGPFRDSAQHAIQYELKCKGAAN